VIHKCKITKQSYGVVTEIYALEIILGDECSTKAELMDAMVVIL